MIPTPGERRARYDDFVASVHDLCTNPGIRAALAKGRGRPVEQCGFMDRYLTRSTAGRPGRRAHYTIAGLIALAGPAAHTPGVRAQPTSANPPRNTASHALPVMPDSPAITPVALAADEAVDWARRRNLGATFAAAVTTRGYNEERTGEQLHVLTRLGDDQVHRRLPSHLTRLLGDGLTPDWAVLLSDLIQRPYQRDAVSLRWRDSFYLALHTPDRR
ncbi:type I-E CRISPR-associated protein Cse2/CasB [Streptomyces exfoliatus]|uniref:type I-E CRISPR-associated protein Cse2/CasB n=1 Tax=Streptomyces exfoliatus TaxID=1905 RepID=UPI00378BBEC5